MPKSDKKKKSKITHDRPLLGISADSNCQLRISLVAWPSRTSKPQNRS